MRLRTLLGCLASLPGDGQRFSYLLTGQEPAFVELVGVVWRGAHSALGDANTVRRALAFKVRLGQLVVAEAVLDPTLGGLVVWSVRRTVQVLDTAPRERSRANRIVLAATSAKEGATATGVRADVVALPDLEELQALLFDRRQLDVLDHEECVAHAAIHDGACPRWNAERPVDDADASTAPVAKIARRRDARVAVAILVEHGLAF